MQKALRIELVVVDQSFLHVHKPAMKKQYLTLVSIIVMLLTVGVGLRVEAAVNSKEETGELLQRCFNVRYVKPTSKRSAWDGRDSWSGNVLQPYGLSTEQRIAALKRLTLPAAVIYVALFDITAKPAVRDDREIQGILCVARRDKSDPLYVAALKRLPELDLDDFYRDLDGGSFGHGVGRTATHFQCTWERAQEVISIMVPRPETRIVPLNSCIEYHVPDYNQAVPSGDAGRGYEVVFESLAAVPGQKKLYDFLKQDDTEWDYFKTSNEIFKAVRCDDETAVLDFVSWMYREHDPFTKTYSQNEICQKLKKTFYSILPASAKSDYAIMIASRKPEESAIKSYDFKFEKQVFVENAAALRKAYGLESDKQLDSKTILGKFYGLIYNDVKRPPFEGMFGVKFGIKVDIEKSEPVKAFGFDFYRVPFAPEKKSKAFEYYDLWVTKITHKVFAIQGRSKTAIAWKTYEHGRRHVPPLVESLEKKYQNMSVDIGPGRMFVFPAEKCTLSVIGNVKGCAEHRIDVTDIFAMDAAFILGDTIGRGVMAKTFEDANAIRASVSDYLMSDLDKEIGCTVVAKNAELAALAEKESKIAQEEARRENDLRKEIEAQSAADAF